MCRLVAVSIPEERAGRFGLSVTGGAVSHACWEAAVTDLKTLNVRKQTLIADKQKVTQDQKAAVRRVKDLLVHLRAAVRSDIGPRSEKLVEWNVAPLRPRSRRARPVETAG